MFPHMGETDAWTEKKLSAGNLRKAEKGRIIHSGSMECTGFFDCAVRTASGIYDFTERMGDYSVPADAYKEVMEESAAAANYTNEIMVSYFSDMMRLIKQIMWKSRDKRIAVFYWKKPLLKIWIN